MRIKDQLGYKMPTRPAASSPLQLAVCLRRIAFGDGVGGLERAAAQHIEEMLRRGHRVTLFTPAAFLRGPVPGGVTLIDVPWPKWDTGGGRPTMGFAYWIWARRLATAISEKKESFHVIHLHGATAGALSNVSREMLRCQRTVVNPHGMEEFGRSFLRFPNRFFLRRMVRSARLATKVIATDAMLVSQIRRNTGARPQQIMTIPNAVDVEYLDSLTKVPADEIFTLVTVGRIVHNKGYDLLLDALKKDHVLKVFPVTWRWIHYGDGPDKHKLVTKAAQAPRVDLDIRSGRPDVEVQQVLSAGSLFVQPSRYEGSSLTTLEAMSHGVTVVGTPVGGIPDKVLDGITGYLAKDVSVDSIAEALIRGVRDEAVTGSRAKQLVRENFSLTAAGQQYENLYASIINSWPSAR